MTMRHLVQWLLTAVCLLVALPASAQTGVLIRLPICEDGAMPSNYRKWEMGYFVPACGSSPHDCDTQFVWAPSADAFRTNNFTMDFGGGNTAYYATEAYCYVNQPSSTHISIFPSPNGGGTSFSALAHVTGFINNVSDSTYVEARVVYSVYSCAQVMVAVQVQQADGSWADQSTSIGPMCDAENNPDCERQVIEVRTYVPSNNNVRLELRPVPWLTDDDRNNLIVNLYEAELFGAECFPNASAPGMCLS